MNEITKNIMNLISERKSSNEICESLQITHHELYKPIQRVCELHPDHNTHIITTHEET